MRITRTGSRAFVLVWVNAEPWLLSVTTNISITSSRYSPSFTAMRASWKEKPSLLGTSSLGAFDGFHHGLHYSKCTVIPVLKVSWRKTSRDASESNMVKIQSISNVIFISEAVTLVTASFSQQLRAAPRQSELYRVSVKEMVNKLSWQLEQPLSSTRALYKLLLLPPARALDCFCFQVYTSPPTACSQWMSY